MGVGSEIARKMACWLCALLCCCFVAFFPKLSYSAVQAPRIVDVGVYINNIPAVNLKEKKFQADFYIWFRWEGDDINPLEDFVLVNGHIDTKDALIKKKIGKINYGSCRVEATIYRNFDLSRYPLDNQTLKIQVEASKYGAGELAYRPDKTNIGASQKIDIPGWRIAKYDSYESVTTYPTNHGDISLSNNAQSNIPRFTLSIDLKRRGYGNFIKLFSMLFLAAALSFCAFLIRSDHIDARFALIVSGVFLAAITQSALSSNLPESDSFGMADQLYNVTMAFILAIFLACIYTFNVFVGGDELKANRISRFCAITLLVTYVLANFIIVGIS